MHAGYAYYARRKVPKMHIMHAGYAYYAPPSCILCIWRTPCGPCTCISCIFCLLRIQGRVTYGFEAVQRRIPFRQDSHIITMPFRTVPALGIHKNQYVRFAVSKNKVIIKPVESNITKRDVAEADRDSAALDRYGEQEDAGYMGDLAEALARKPDDVGSGRIEKLRMK